VSVPEPPLPGEVHLWLASPDTVCAERAAALLGLLDVDERERWARFRLERHRREYLAAHALLRLSLSRHAAVRPSAWSFSAGPRGRPEVAGPCVGLALRFNLTHTAGLVACAVTAGGDVGVDAERVERRRDLLGLAAHVLAPGELQDVRDQPEEARPGRFYDYWTLKEAYAKAHGAGLALPLRSVCFGLQGAGRVAATFHPPLDDDPAGWWFTLLRPTPEHRAAVAVRVPPGSEARLRVRFLRWPAPPGG